jgi:hypothetical protein
MTHLIDPRQLPLWTPVVTTDTATVRVVVTRIDAEHVRITYFQPITADLLLDLVASVDGQHCRLLHFDRVFWTVTIDGLAATEAAIDDLTRKQQLRFRFDPQARQMDVWLTGH